MNIKALLNDDDAVSPVIGVILMVAITVILAAVIASFVLGLGDQNNPAPTADFTFDYDGAENVTTVTHGNGDSVLAENLYIRGQGIDESTTFSTTTPPSWNNLDSGSSIGDDTSPYTTVSYGPSDEIGAGNNAYVKVNGPDYVINVVWEDPDSDSTSTLSTDEGPDA
jgi:flagellin-like protein